MVYQIHAAWRRYELKKLGRGKRPSSRVTGSSAAANSPSTQGMPQPVFHGSPRPSPPTSRVTRSSAAPISPSTHGMPQPAFQGSSRPLPPISRVTYNPDQYHAVYDFLQTSMPPTTHLMDAFIDFGCDSGDFLRAMSKWPSERITYVLDHLSPGGDGRLTGLEKLILQNHFKDYFA